MATTIAAPLSGKCAIITGGSRGIGAAIARELARLGASKIAITYNNNQDAARGVVQSVESQYSGVTAIDVQADLLSPTFGRSIISEVRKQLQIDKFDIVVNNAALTGGESYEPFEEITYEVFEKTMRANLWAPLDLIKASLPFLNHGGRIINISSTSSTRPNPDPIMTYGMSKAALDNLTKSLAKRYAAEKGITINSVVPGPTDTDMINRLAKGDDKIITVISQGATAANRIGQPEDVAEIVGFVASPGARWINGNHLPANGGRVPDSQT